VTRIGTTEIRPAKISGMKAVATTATTRNSVSSSVPRRDSARVSIRSSPRRSRQTRSTISAAATGTGVTLSPAVSAVGTTAKLPNGIAAKNR
jgi:hypothetical protein